MTLLLSLLSKLRPQLQKPLRLLSQKVGEVVKESVQGLGYIVLVVLRLYSVALVWGLIVMVLFTLQRRRCLLGRVSPKKIGCLLWLSELEKQIQNGLEGVQRRFGA